MIQAHNSLIHSIMKDDIKSIINQVYEDTYQIPNIMKLMGSILMDLKRDVVPICNQDALKYLMCKGTSTRKITPHQACQGASSYVAQYYLKEGYNLDSAKQLGCTMWNQLNDCSYFPIWKTKLFVMKIKSEEDDTIHDANLHLLEKMCRTHHKKCDISVIKHMEYHCGPSKWRPITYWMCFDKAISKLPKQTLYTEKDIDSCLEKWNQDNDVAFFVIKQ